jgi:hypothetical protein
MATWVGASFVSPSASHAEVGLRLLKNACHDWFSCSGNGMATAESHERWEPSALTQICAAPRQVLVHHDPYRVVDDHHRDVGGVNR